MTTDISVTTTAHVAEKRGWLWGEHGTEPGATPSVTLDVAAFTGATHYPNGHIPSGIVLGRITASGLYGPYDPAAVDGTEDPAGLLFSSVAVRAGSTKIGGAILVHGFVDPARLPFPTGTGAADEAAQAALTLIYWA